MAKRNGFFVWPVLLMVLALLLMPALAAAQDEVTILGVINETGQLVDEAGVVYEIADTEEGFAVMELSGQEVSVTGTVMEADGTQILAVTSYEIME